MASLPKSAESASAAVAPRRLAAPLDASPSAPHWILRYGVAVLTFIGALVLALLLRRFELRESLFLMAIAVTVWYGRMGAGLVAIVLSILGLDYFFIPPIYHIEAGLTHLPYFIVFTSFALIISWFSASRRRAEQGLRQARDELEQRVAERTAELRHTTTQAVAAQQRFGDLVNSVEGIVWEADASTFQFLFVSKQAERILGYPTEQWLSEAAFWRDHLHPEDREWAVKFSTTAMAERRSHDFEYRMLASDGRAVWFRDLVTVVVDGLRATRRRGVMFDITSRKKAEEALRQAQAELAHVSRLTTMGELTASLAHEINQPIAAAVTNAHTCLRWLNRPRPDLEEARLAASRIVKDVTRASEVISSTRSLFKKAPAQRQLVDVNELLREMIVLLQNEASHSSISIRTQFAENLPSIVGDRVQLQQVFMNLMLNGIDAIKATGSAGEINIRTQPSENGELLISVSDTGVGLPKDHSDQIFSAFFTTKPQGTGLGLTISRSIVESHGGRLWATPNEGRGTTFQLTLVMKGGA